MELINNVFLLLLLALSSLFSSAIAICVPRNSPGFQFPSAALVKPIAQQKAPPVTVSQSKSPSPPANSAPTSTASDKASASGGDSGSVLQKLPSNLLSSVTSSVMADLVKICHVTNNPHLCTTSISPHIHGSTMNPVFALKTEIEASIKEVEKAIAKLNVLSTTSGASKAEMACYDTCLENFDMAIEDLKAGAESIDAHDVGRMESVLSAVLTDLMTCDDTFAEMGVDSPLDNLSTTMSKFASNCLAISKLLL